MNKFLALFASVMSTTAIAQETAVKQPEFWSPVVEHQIQRDIPQYLGYTDNAGLLMSTYDPNSVSSGYLGFLQSAEMISNLIFASIVAVAVLFAVFVLINGRAKLTEGFSGKLVQRWSVGDVVLHWCVAIPCIILILSGFVIGAGKVWLAPMMTPAHFHSLVYASVLFHNIFAIPFIIAAVILMVKWSKNQLPESCDGKWFLALGGYINIGGKAKHPDAGFANAGEKAFFWTFTIFGLALVATGLL
ncbi:MAG TPA: formate dehydrogenase subunit gamma, partial [Sutterellaceae bacterium]|nr:formate dehydrogenase subunit gamma [Sutterellaceae bacterium]